MLCNLFMNAKIIKGNLYQPVNLTGFKNSLQRILVSRITSYDLKKILILSGRRKELTKLGKGNKSTHPLNEKEVNFLYDHGYFGTASPISLQRAVWWIITKTFW